MCVYARGYACTTHTFGYTMAHLKIISQNSIMVEVVPQCDPNTGREQFAEFASPIAEAPGRQSRSCGRQLKMETLGQLGRCMHHMQKNPWLSSEAYTKFRYNHGIQSLREQPFAKLCNLGHSSDTGSHMTRDSPAWAIPSTTSDFPNPGPLTTSSGVLSAC